MSSLEANLHQAQSGWERLPRGALGFALANAVPALAGQRYKSGFESIMATSVTATTAPEVPETTSHKAI